MTTSDVVFNFRQLGLRVENGQHKRMVFSNDSGFIHSHTPVSSLHSAPPAYLSPQLPCRGVQSGSKVQGASDCVPHGGEALKAFTCKPHSTE